MIRKRKEQKPNQSAWLSIRLQHLDQDSITSADVSIDGSRVVTGSNRGRVTLWNSESEVGTTTTANDSSERELLNLHQFFSGVRLVQFGADDANVVSFEADSASHSALVIPTK